jgi:predicted nucleic acid-binding protein
LNAHIVDASVAIKWVVAETGTPEALELLGHRLMAPALFQVECANILWKKVKRREMSAREGGLAVRLLADFGVELCAPEPDLSRVLELAVALDHPAYDCVYLALAESRGVPLVTADVRLIRAVQTARQSGLTLDKSSILPLIDQPSAH